MACVASRAGARRDGHTLPTRRSSDLQAFLAERILQPRRIRQVELLQALQALREVDIERRDVVVVPREELAAHTGEGFEDETVSGRPRGDPLPRRALVEPETRGERVDR